MLNLFKAELLRFRAWAIAYAVLHLLLLGFMTRLVDLAQQPLLVYRVVAAVYVLTGLLLGLYQLAGYRRPSTWLNLLHRPLPHWKVAAALFGAGVVLLVLAIAIPILLIAAWQETMTARVVDLRHLLLALSALMIAACAYLAGGYIMLGSRRYSWCALVLLILLVTTHASGVGVLAVQALLLAWLTVLVVTAFKPDLSAPPSKPLPVVATALPLQMGLYLLLATGVGIGSELAWVVLGTSPNNTPTPPRGGVFEANIAEGRDLMIAGLARSPAPEAPLWREQVALSEVFRLGPDFDSVSKRNELTNLQPMEFDDGQRGLRWVFSHDSMRLEGYRVGDQRAVGGLGLGNGNAAFPVPVLPAGRLPGLAAGDSLLLGGGELFQYGSETRTVLPRVHLPVGEVFAARPAMVGETIAMLGDRALYFFDQGKVLETDEVLTPRLRVPMPGKAGNLNRIDLIELVDGYLVSFAFTRGPYHGQVDATQQLLHVHDDGGIETVATRALNSDFPTWFLYVDWWMSPSLHAARGVASALFAATDPLQATSALTIPRGMRWLAGLMSLLSLLGALWWQRRLSLSLPARAAWVVACALIGIPALLSLWLLYRPQEQETAPTGQRSHV